MAGPEQVGGMPLHVEAAILVSYWVAQGEGRKAPVRPSRYATLLPLAPVLVEHADGDGLRRPVHVRDKPVAQTKARPGSDGVHFQERLTVSGSTTEEVMSKSILSSRWFAALAGGAMLALELSPASAFTLSGPSVRPVTSGEFDKVYYRGYHGVYRGRYHGVYHGGYAYHGGYGYHPYGYGGGVVARHVLHTSDQPTRDLQWLWNDP
jgi:hypothetical protein